MKSPFHGISEGLYLSSMAVDATARRLGIGRALLQAAESRASERCAECLWLFVEQNNVPAIALYDSNGYTKQADSPRFATFAAALELGRKQPVLFRKAVEKDSSTTDL